MMSSVGGFTLNLNGTPFSSAQITNKTQLTEFFAGKGLKGPALEKTVTAFDEAAKTIAAGGTLTSKNNQGVSITEGVTAGTYADGLQTFASRLDLQQGHGNFDLTLTENELSEAALAGVTSNAGGGAPKVATPAPSTTTGTTPTQQTEPPAAGANPVAAAANALGLGKLAENPLVKLGVGLLSFFTSGKKPDFSQIPGMLAEAGIELPPIATRAINLFTSGKLGGDGIIGAIPEIAKASGINLSPEITSLVSDVVTGKKPWQSIIGQLAPLLANLVSGKAKPKTPPPVQEEPPVATPASQPTVPPVVTPPTT